MDEMEKIIGVVDNSVQSETSFPFKEGHHVVIQNRNRKCIEEMMDVMEKDNRSNIHCTNRSGSRREEEV